NSHISDVDTLTQDDRDGAMFLYSQPLLSAPVQASSGSGSGGGCTLRPGMGVNPTLGGVFLLLAVCRTWLRTRLVQAGGQRTTRPSERAGGKPNLANSDSVGAWGSRSKKDSRGPSYALRFSTMWSLTLTSDISASQQKFPHQDRHMRRLFQGGHV